MNFRTVIDDLHMKYPVIRTKQLIPVFPHIPNKYRKMDFPDKGSCDSTSHKPEFTT